MAIKTNFHFEGSTFGLKLVINMESYEYMSGPPSDSGIKVGNLDPLVSWLDILLFLTQIQKSQTDRQILEYSKFCFQMFLHSQNEVPMITDLGFAIPPGRHSLIAVKASEVPNQLTISICEYKYLLENHTL